MIWNPIARWHVKRFQRMLDAWSEQGICPVCDSINEHHPHWDPQMGFAMLQEQTDTPLLTFMTDDVDHTVYMAIYDRKTGKALRLGPNLMGLLAFNADVAEVIKDALDPDAHPDEVHPYFFEGGGITALMGHGKAELDSR